VDLFIKRAKSLFQEFTARLLLEKIDDDDRNQDNHAATHENIGYN
jgi:hypothetical protein